MGNNCCQTSAGHLKDIQPKTVLSTNPDVTKKKKQKQKELEKEKRKQVAQGKGPSVPMGYGYDIDKNVETKKTRPMTPKQERRDNFNEFDESCNTTSLFFSTVRKDS